MPHPAGKISVDYNNSENGLNAEIKLPEGISGTFVWKGKNYNLKGGLNKLGQSRKFNENDLMSLVQEL